MRRRRGWRKETGLTGGPHRSATEGEGGGAGPRGEAGQAGRRGEGSWAAACARSGREREGRKGRAGPKREREGREGLGFGFKTFYDFQTTHIQTKTMQTKNDAQALVASKIIQMIFKYLKAKFI